MSARYIPDADCFAAANEASGKRLHPDEINAAFQRLSDYREKLRAAGDIDGMAEKLQAFAEREAERTRLAAAMQRRHAAMNVLVRDRAGEVLKAYRAAGMTGREALLALLEGSQKGVQGARNSVAALNLAYEARYLGAMMSELQGVVPHFRDIMNDARLDADIMREMSELRPGGKIGVTGNADAQKVARIFAKYAELSRTDLNKLGASIGKLEGWSGSQTHDDLKMIAAGKEAWSDFVASKLDLERTFPDIEGPEELRRILGDMYDTIVTGVPNNPTPREMAQRVNPANLARSLGKSRVLHFKDPDAALAYRAQFGYGNTISGMFSHLRHASRMAANMEALGPNPELMFGSLAEAVKRDIRDDVRLDDATRRNQIAEIDVTAGALKQAIDIATGLASRPVSVNAAKLGSDLRAAQSMAKLGGSAITSIADVPVAAIASMFRGSGFVRGMVRQIDGIMRGRPKGEQAEIAFMLGEGFDGIIGHIASPAAASDAPLGKLAGMQEKFFRFNGQAWWTDVNRGVAARVIAAEMGMRAKTAFGKLPPAYRHVLSLHGIDQARWDVIRQAEFREINGNSYITPDRIRALSDDAIAPLVEKRLAAARKAAGIDAAKGADAKAKAQADYDARRASILDDGRRELELSVLRFVADETNYGVIEVDARARRFMTRGQRPGTVGGEALRYVGQFKGFPVAFAQRVWGRALMGHRQFGSRAERMLVQGGHLGAVIAGTTMAGYMSLTMKDWLKGYWPPRDPFDVKTILAAMVQGGAAGIYGDFLFGQTNSFGGGVLETIAGPTIGAVADGVEIAMKLREAGEGAIEGEEAKMPLGDALNLALQNTPYANLFYVRPALDYLMVNSMREAVSPGYLRRQERNRMRDYGQERSSPMGLGRMLQEDWR